MDCTKVLAVKPKRVPPSRMTRTNVLRVFLLVVLVGVAFLSFWLIQTGGPIGNNAFGLWITTVLISVGPELAGIFIGAVTLDYLNERRQQEQLKAGLIRRMGSSHNEVVDLAVRELAAEGWLSDGSLNGKSFVKADLSNCDLGWAVMIGADFENACFWGAELSIANLKNAHLFMADLQDTRAVSTILSGSQLQGTKLDRAILHGAMIQNAVLSESSLVDADLCHAHLNGASLGGTNLTGADLRFANLSGATVGIDQLRQASSLLGTIMPDGVQIGLRGQPTFEEWCKKG
jgi:uncharacterized protein YjbI with pentapeptide repeats